MFDARPTTDITEEYRRNNTLKKAKQSGAIRNLNKDYEEVKKIITYPFHKKVNYKIQNMHETAQLVDPFHWVQDITPTQLEQFKSQEGQFTRLMLLKYDYLDKMMLREFEHYSQISKVEPIQIGEYIYYRRAENAADNLTLYRFPVSELQKYGLKNEVPYLRKPSTDDLDEEQQEEYSRLEQEFPEKTLFNLSDLVNFY